jgi:hypothetical protein
VCSAGVGNVLLTSVCTSPPVLEAEVLWSGLEFIMMVALSSNLFKSNNENLVSCSVDCFEKLLDIKRRRLESTAEALRMADVCVQIPSTFSEG